VSIRIIKRSPVINNSSLFVLLSVFFLHMTESLYNGVSSFDKKYLIDFYYANKAVIFFSAITFYSVFTGKKISKYLLFILTASISFLQIKIFASNFDKVILFLSVFYILTSYFFVVCLASELNDSCYVPGYNKWDLEKVSHFPLVVRVDDLRGNVSEGHLTNWNKSGCFLYFDKGNESKRGKVLLNIKAFGREFEHKGEVVSSYFKGMGVKLTGNVVDQHEVLNWTNLCEILSDRGYLK